MTHFLENDCYCPGEIYDTTGFFFKVFSPEDECHILAKGQYNDTDVISVICKDQIINFFMEGNNKILDAERYDATENNIEVMPRLLSGDNSEPWYLDCFKEGEPEKTLNDILGTVDMIMKSR